MYNYLIFIYEVATIFTISSREHLFIKISYSQDFLIPTIDMKIKNKNLTVILDNNLNFNYITTKSFNLADINFHYNNDQINIKDKIYQAYFYIGDLTIFDEKNYIHLENFNSFVIDDKTLISSVTISYLLQQLKEESFINKKIFHLDINNKICYFGEVPLNSGLISQILSYDNYICTTFYSNNTKGIFKQKLNYLFIGTKCLFLNKIVSFFINEYYIIVPYPLLNEILKELGSIIDCNLFLIDQRGIYGIKCLKNDIIKLQNMYFVFENNYTFNIPLYLLFEDYDENYKVSLFRNKLKYRSVSFEDNEEIIIGYSLIKYFNYSIFSYDERSVSFYSDLFIDNHPPKFPYKIISFLLIFLVCLLGIASLFLIFIKYQKSFYI